jgi:predicted amidohydrolase YtcJ
MRDFLRQDFPFFKLSNQFLLITLFTFFFLSVSVYAEEKADQIYYNGTIITMSTNTEIAEVEAIAVKGEKIAAVGRADEIMKDLKGENTILHNLKGKTMMPGFIAPHMHYLAYGDALDWIDVSSSNTFFRPSPPWRPTRQSSEIIEKIKEALNDAKSKDQWILVWAFDPSRQKEDVPINRDSLDKASPDNPVLIANNSGHFAYANTPALKQFNICGTLGNQDSKKCANAGLSTDETENAKNGILQEGAVLLALATVSPKDAKGWIKPGNRAAEIMAKRGFTTVNDIVLESSMMDAYPELTKNEDFPVNIIASPLGAYYFDSSENGYKAWLKKNKDSLNDRIRLGPVKYYADGSPQGFTAFMLQPYKTNPPWVNQDEPYRGAPNYPDILRKQMTEVHAAGDQLAIHVNGDASLEMVLDILEEALIKKPNPDSRHLFIHLPFAVSDPKLKQLDRIKQNGFEATFLINNLYYWGQAYCNVIFGGERVKNIYPLKSALKAGLPLTLHTDAPINPPDPFHLMWVAVTRKAQQWNGPFNKECPEVLGPDERISIEDALKAYTINAAYQFFMEDKLGSLEEGKFADMAILSDNPLSMKESLDRLLDIKIIATVNRGKLHVWVEEN